MEFACTIIEILDRGIYPFKNKSNNEVIDYLTNDQYNGLSMLISMNGILNIHYKKKIRVYCFLVRCLDRNSQSLSFGELIQNLGSIHNIENIYAYNYTRQHTLFRYPEGYDTSPDIEYIEIQNDPFEIIQEQILLDESRRIINIEPINPYPTPVFDELTLEQMRQSHLEGNISLFFSELSRNQIYGLAPQQERILPLFSSEASRFPLYGRGRD